MQGNSTLSLAERVQERVKRTHLWGCLHFRQTCMRLPFGIHRWLNYKYFSFFSILFSPIDCSEDLVQMNCMCVCLYTSKALFGLLLWYKGSAMLFGSQAVILWSPYLSRSIIEALCAWRLNFCLFLPFLFWRQWAACLHLKCLFGILALCEMKTVSKEWCDSTAGGSIWTFSLWPSTLSQQHVSDSCRKCHFSVSFFTFYVFQFGFFLPVLLDNFFFKRFFSV